MKQFHKNPRQITTKQYSDLETWLKKYGDLSGVVHDLNSDQVIGGNQRSVMTAPRRRQIMFGHRSRSEAMSVTGSAL